MKSKTLIKKQLQKKTNPELVETVISAKRNKQWFKVAELLSGPTKKRIALNLSEINEKAKQGEKVIVPGKVLSQGEINKKFKIGALGFSEKAKEKLLSAGCEIITILKEIKSNPSAKDVKILK